MADRTFNTIKMIGILAGIMLAIASPIIAVDRANNSNAFVSEAAAEDAKAALAKAESAKELAEKNARDFEYFKGEMTATMKAHKDGLDKMDRKMDQQDVKLDKLLIVMSGFIRVDDGK